LSTAKLHQEFILVLLGQFGNLMVGPIGNQANGKTLSFKFAHTYLIILLVYRVHLPISDKNLTKNRFRIGGIAFYGDENNEKNQYNSHYKNLL
jgi:hypothetical protein